MAKEFVKKPVMSDKSRCTEQLLRDIKKNDTSKMSKRDRLVVENTKFVVTVANQYQGLGVEVEDLVQIGLEAMIRAAEKFDESRDVHFISYAVHDIRNAILRAINRDGKTVKIPMGMQLKDIQLARLELPQNDAEGKGVNLIEKLANELADEADKDVTEADERAYVTRLLTRLKPRERDVVIWSYGLSGQTLSSGERYHGDTLPQTEIAAMMRLSEESVRLIRESALGKMRHLETR